jgi:hypothetical protein
LGRCSGRCAAADRVRGHRVQHRRHLDGEGSGAFKNQGLDVQFVYISSSATSVQGLLGGSIDVMVGGASGIGIAAARRAADRRRFADEPGAGNAP